MYKDKLLKNFSKEASAKKAALHQKFASRLNFPSLKDKIAEAVSKGDDCVRIEVASLFDTSAKEVEASREFQTFKEDALKSGCFGVTAFNYSDSGGGTDHDVMACVWLKKPTLLRRLLNKL